MTITLKIEFITFIMLAMTHTFIEAVGTTIKPLSRDKYWKVKCTRRFTVGFCPNQAVTSVYTYTVSTQNCTERMGCPLATNTQNRFQSYEQCIITCQPITSLIVYKISNKSITRETITNLIGLTKDKHSFIKEVKNAKDVPEEMNHSDEYK